MEKENIETSLHLAVSIEKPEIVKLLLSDKRINPNIKNNIFN